MVFTPYLGLKLLPDLAKPGATRDPDAIYDTRIYRALRRRHRLRAALAQAPWSPSRSLVFVAAIAGFGFVQQQFFPTSTRTELFFELRLPEGTAIGVTDAAAKKAETAARPAIPTSSAYTTYVGQGSPRFWLGLNPVLPNPNFAQIVIVPRISRRASASRRGSTQAIADGALPQARARVDRFVFGPPVGFPVQFRVVGPDPMKVRAIAEQVRTVMAANPQDRRSAPQLGRAWRNRSASRSTRTARARSGLTPQDVAQTLQTLLSGYTVTQYREGIEHIDVVARAVPSERLELDRLPALTIATRNGVAVPLSQIARLDYELRGADPVAAQPRHRADRARRHRRQRAGARCHQRSRCPSSPSIKDALPYGYRIETGGSIEESAKANGCAGRGVPGHGASRCWRLLMIQLQSFSRLALVFVTAPLGLIGATGALLVSNRPFGFVALLGLIALAGMIMRNTVILVDQIDHDIAAGHARYRAIIDATVRRARPVALTALAAILGMIPLARSIFWGPMAITIMGGLFVATVLTLLVVPALYALWFRVGRSEAAEEHVRAGDLAAALAAVKDRAIPGPAPLGIAAE